MTGERRGHPQNLSRIVFFDKSKCHIFQGMVPDERICEKKTSDKSNCDTLQGMEPAEKPAKDISAGRKSHVQS